MDFYCAIVLMVVGVVCLIKGVVASNERSSDSGVPKKLSGAMFLVAGVVEGISWGVGAAGVWG